MKTSSISPAFTYLKPLGGNFWLIANANKLLLSKQATYEDSLFSSNQSKALIQLSLFL